MVRKFFHYSIRYFANHIYEFSHLRLRLQKFMITSNEWTLLSFESIYLNRCLLDNCNSFSALPQTQSWSLNSHSLVQLFIHLLWNSWRKIYEDQFIKIRLSFSLGAVRSSSDEGYQTGVGRPASAPPVPPMPSFPPLPHPYCQSVSTYFIMLLWFAITQF